MHKDTIEAMPGGKSLGKETLGATKKNRKGFTDKKTHRVPGV